MAYPDLINHLQTRCLDLESERDQAVAARKAAQEESHRVRETNAQLRVERDMERNVNGLLAKRIANQRRALVFKDHEVEGRSAVVNEYRQKLGLVIEERDRLRRQHEGDVRGSEFWQDRSKDLEKELEAVNQTVTMYEAHRSGLQAACDHLRTQLETANRTIERLQAYGYGPSLIQRQEPTVSIRFEDDDKDAHDFVWTMMHDPRPHKRTE